MKYKNLEFTGIDQLINPKSERVVKLAWKNSLEHQIKAENLPSFEVIKNDLEKLFNKNFGNVIINEEIEKDKWYRNQQYWNKQVPALKERGVCLFLFVKKIKSITPPGKSALGEAFPVKVRYPNPIITSVKGFHPYSHAWQHLRY